MRRLTGALIRMYPPAWRARYGSELEALMADAPCGWSAVFDVIQGAIVMKIRMFTGAKMMAGFVLAGMLAGLGLYTILPRHWKAKAIGTAGGAELLVRAHAQLTSRQSLAELINDPKLDLYRSERRTQPLEDVVDTMRRGISVQVAPTSKVPGTVFSVSFVYPDPRKAQATTNVLMSRLATSLQGFELLDAASLPRQPSSPNRTPLMLAGALAGLTVSLLALGWRRFRTPPGAGLQPA